MGGRVAFSIKLGEKVYKQEKDTSAWIREAELWILMTYL